MRIAYNHKAGRWEWRWRCGSLNGVQQYCLFGFVTSRGLMNRANDLESHFRLPDL